MSVRAIFPILMFVVIGFGSSVWAKIQILPHQVGIIGYGSLLSQTSMSKTLGRPYDGPVIETKLKGYVRDFSAVMPNENAFYAETGSGKRFPKGIAYYNLTPEIGSEVSVMLFVIDRRDLADFDRREWIYDHVSVKSSSLEAQVDGEVMVYIAKPEYSQHQANENVAVRRSYLRLVEAAVDQLSPEFKTRFYETTRLPRFEVIDDHQVENSDPFGNLKKKQNLKRKCEHLF